MSRKEGERPPRVVSFSRATAGIAKMGGEEREVAGWEVPRSRHHHRQRDRGRDRRRDAFASAVTRRGENGNGTANLGASGGKRIYGESKNVKSKKARNTYRPYDSTPTWSSLFAALVLAVRYDKEAWCSSEHHELQNL